jgi:hypothetical protein
LASVTEILIARRIVVIDHSMVQINRPNLTYKTCDIAAGMIHVWDEAASDWIGHPGEDDRDGARGFEH